MRRAEQFLILMGQARFGDGARPCAHKLHAFQLVDWWLVLNDLAEFPLSKSWLKHGFV